MPEEKNPQAESKKIKEAQQQEAKLVAGSQKVTGTQAPAEAPQTAPKKNKKIGKMTLEETEQRLQEVKAKMKTLDSRYARQLVKRKEALLQIKDNKPS